jgi:hypothetical protein
VCLTFISSSMWSCNILKFEAQNCSFLLQNHFSHKYTSTPSVYLTCDNFMQNICMNISFNLWFSNLRSLVLACATCYSAYCSVMVPTWQKARYVLSSGLLLLLNVIVSAHTVCHWFSHFNEAGHVLKQDSLYLG